jgi:hypothetical protein
MGRWDKKDSVRGLTAGAGKDMMAPGEFRGSTTGAVFSSQ